MVNRRLFIYCSLAPMLNKARRLPYFPPDDAFFTRVLSTHLNFTRIQSKLFATTLRTMYTCDMLSERYLSVTPMTMKMHVKIWEAFVADSCDPSDSLRSSKLRLARVF